jgi:hypothetical protein
MALARLLSLMLDVSRVDPQTDAVSAAAAG